MKARQSLTHWTTRLCNIAATISQSVNNITKQLQLIEITHTISRRAAERFFKSDKIKTCSCSVWRDKLSVLCIEAAQSASCWLRSAVRGALRAVQEFSCPVNAPRGHWSGSSCLSAGCRREKTGRYKEEADQRKLTSCSLAGGRTGRGTGWRDSGPTWDDVDTDINLV